MATPSEYRTLVENLVEPINGRMEWSSTAEAKAHKARVAQVQKDLRRVKQEITAEIRAINSRYQTRKAMIGKSFTAGLAAAFFGSRRAGRINAINRDALRREQYDAVLPYQECKNHIDSILADLDRVTVHIDAQQACRRAVLPVRTNPQEPALALSSLDVEVVRQPRKHRLARLVAFVAIAFISFRYVGGCNQNQPQLAVVPQVEPAVSGAGSPTAPVQVDSTAAGPSLGPAAVLPAAVARAVQEPAATSVSAESAGPAQSAPALPVAEDAQHDFSEPAAPKHRMWHDLHGHQVDAVFDGLAGDKALLKKLDGHQVAVDVSKLSDDDFNYLHAIGTRSIGKRQLTGKIVGITDGDTVTIHTDDNRQIKIRLAGIDAPERSQAFGTRAREALAKKIIEKQVRIDWQGLDKYGRTIGDIYLDDRWINKEMVEEGWAWHYLKYSDSPDLAVAEQEARSSKAGLWRDSDPVPPWDFRHSAVAASRANPKAQPAEARFPSKAASKSAAAPEKGDNLPITGPDSSEVVTGYTATGIPIHTGPRGGQYHYSSSGKKVYERRKK